ncbi:MAG TPA: hypothetical protein VKI65_06575, partial [Gemmataceae bacterium]|nr:hypothetical protein [Gemmataceae bacterium]
QEVQQRAGVGLSEGRTSRSPASFSDVLAETLFIPTGAAPAEETEQRLREQIQRHFEESWIHRPRRSLNGVAPVDAAGHPTLRKKLLGVIAFFEQCAAAGGTPYDFGRLRRKLGLIPGDSPTPADSGEIDIEALSAAQLAALDADALADEQLERAYQAAMKLDARELAGRFAQALVNRPARPERPDRFPWFSHLVQLALNEGDADSALDYLDEGEKRDCEENEGRRRNDYELRRGQIHARRGEVEAAQELFERLITRAPADLRYPGTAAEALLSARQGNRALRFAEQGLAKAREQSNRDSEEYYLELVAAAKKQLA